ncbi:MAG TPA: PEP-utilizing enzyme [Thiolinea sp.]|nr:PEP-utilizing enzyme [Thiolinea sp.]
MASLIELPAKYQRLVEAAQAGLPTPQTLLVTNPDDSVNEFLANFSEQSQFIVRSANRTEDGSGHSLAGHFWSSAAVSREAVPETIQLAWLENQRLLDSLNLKQTPLLMLQDYIQHHLGGVLFMPWSFFSEYAYMEYSRAGVQQVVAGQAQSALLSLNSAHSSPMPIADEFKFLEAQLVELAQHLKAAFQFPVDCEWAYSLTEQRLVVLQVRAQTHAIGPLLPRPKELAHTDSHWQFTALSESLGKISPLSFSLLVQLYKDAIPDLQRLGCKAVQVNFLAYQPDGTVLVEPSLEQQFYANTLLGGFWRGFRAGEFKLKAEQALASVDAAQAFSYAQLSKLFKVWLIQNLLQSGQGREVAPPIHAYELSWLNSADTLKLSDQAPLNLQLRHAFLLELNKLKRVLVSHKELVFCQWSEYQQQEFSQALARQYAAARLAIYDYALTSEGSEFQSLAAATVVTGTILRVQQTNLTLVYLPATCILVSPYFDNRWVQMIPSLKGIIVLQGSRLAHSALVAREYGIPYVVVSSAQFAELSSGQRIELDARQGQLRQVTV